MDISTLSEVQISNEMVENQIAFSDVMGYFPTYMRSPYAKCTPVCETVRGELGCHIVYYNIDEEGFLNDDVSLV